MIDTKQTAKPLIPDETLSKWQRIVDLLADILTVPAALVAIVHETTIRVLAASRTEGNPYKTGVGSYLYEGSYCERVIKISTPLLVTDATNKREWDRSPDVGLGMISFLGFPLRWPDGQVFGTVCVLDNTPNFFTDYCQPLLSEFKCAIDDDLASLVQDANLQQTGRALRQASQEWDLTFNAMSYGVSVHDIQGNVLSANQAVVKMLGIPLKELKANKCYTLFHGACTFIEDCPLVASRLSKKRESREIFEPYVDRWLSISASPIFGADGEVEKVVHLLRDISDQKRAERELSESEATNRALLGAIPDMMFRVSGDGTYLGFKPGRNGEPFVDSDVFLGKKIQEIMPPELAEDQLRVMRLALETGEVQILEHQLLQSGEVRDYEARFAPCGEGEVLAIARDITERKRMQQQLVHSDKLAAIGTLVAGVAHEVNNPLAGALGHVDLLLRGELGDEIREDLQVVRSETQRAVGIMRNLLSFSRERKPERNYISLNDVLEATLELREYELRVRNVEVQKDLQADLPKTMADYSQMQQVFVNLVLNSEQAILEAGDHGVISVESHQKGDMIRVTISDDGPGIPPAILSKIFDPFFTTKLVGKGSGLGLSICYGIITQHGGAIRASSKFGQGAVFTVEMPIVIDTGSPDHEADDAHIE